MNILIRNANKVDAEQIASVHYRAWLETYTGMLPESYLSTRSMEKSTALFRANQCRNTVVAERDGAIIGFCGWGAFRESVPHKHMGEIQGIYLLNEYKRNHIGQKMLAYALEQLKSAGYRKAGLWVLRDNRNAIAFYEKLGFIRSDAVKEANLGQPVTELLYTKDLRGDNPDNGSVNELWR